MESKRKLPERKPARPPVKRKAAQPVDAFLESQNGTVIEHIADGPDARDDFDRLPRDD